jgi:hypothetical protein
MCLVHITNALAAGPNPHSTLPISQAKHHPPKPING